MTTRYKLFTQVRPFYSELTNELNHAKTRISMTYYTFDDGEWAQKMADTLCRKAAAGIKVCMMVDAIGIVMDEPRHALRNRSLIARLNAAGVQVEIFNPKGYRLNQSNRLHSKICAIDGRTVFLGGSNIGDHYIGWDDNNLRVDGDLGETFHQVFDYIRGHSVKGVGELPYRFHPSRLTAGDAKVWLTIPKQRQDIRRAMLDMILSAEKAIYIRNWYFLPDKEILDALRSQARRGVQVNVLLSHKTRVRPVDVANYIHCHKLAKAGGKVYRYTGGYMHAKVAWNDKGDVLFGSANMDCQALKDNFECSIVFRDATTARQLERAFELDMERSFVQTPEIFRQRSLPMKALSYACNLASPWL